VTDSGQHINKKPKILDFSVFENAVKVSKCQEYEIEKHACADAVS